METHQRIKKLRAELASLEAQPHGTSQATRTSTPDFRDFVLWQTWRYGPNRGAGEFEEWLLRHGERLTALWDERLLARIAQWKAKGVSDRIEDGDDWTRGLLLRHDENMLSWEFSVPSEYRQHSHRFWIIEE